MSHLKTPVFFTASWMPCFSLTCLTRLEKFLYSALQCSHFSFSSTDFSSSLMVSSSPTFSSVPLLSRISVEKLSIVPLSPSNLANCSRNSLIILSFSSRAFACSPSLPSSSCSLSTTEFVSPSTGSISTSPSLPSDCPSPVPLAFNSSLSPSATSEAKTVDTSSSSSCSLSKIEFVSPLTGSISVSSICISTSPSLPSDCPSPGTTTSTNSSIVSLICTCFKSSPSSTSSANLIFFANCILSSKESGRRHRVFFDTSGLSSEVLSGHQLSSESPLPSPTMSAMSAISAVSSKFKAYSSSLYLFGF